MDPDFRTLFLFQDDSCHDFVKEFSDRQPRMSEFLKELEANAAQLDSMSKGAKISSVVGSSVGALGGVLSIVGLALSPVTAGASLALTVAGVGMGVTSGVNGVVTTATEVGVNRTHQRKASEVLQRFADDATKLQECLEDEMQQTLARIQTSRTEAAVGVDLASAAKLLQSEEVAAGAAKVMAQEGKALCGVSRLASDVPDVGQAAVKGSLVASKSLRAGLIAANALFLGMDVFFICKDSIGLARGHESQAARLIRARAALWGSEMDSWKKIHDSLSDAMPTSGKKEAVLETPFYPHVGLQKQE